MAVESLISVLGQLQAAHIEMLQLGEQKRKQLLLTKWTF